jgi:hypothetical protein
MKIAVNSIRSVMACAAALLALLPALAQAQYNTYYGAGALQSGSITGLDESAFGASALHYTTYGAYNTGFGANALLFNKTGVRNTAAGVNALYANTIGAFNTAFGMSALGSNTTGSGNTAVGFQSLFSCTTDSQETATGYQALFSDGIGYGGVPNQNVAMGFQALYSSTDGFENLAAGYRALYSDINGDQNTAVGYQALFGITTGGNNIAIGHNAGDLLTSGSSDIDIGHPGVAGESNVIRIGDGVSQQHTYLTGVIHGNGSGLTGIVVPAGSITSADLAPGASARPVSVTGSSATAVANTIYAVTGTGAATFTLPATANLGDQVQVLGTGTTGWTVIGVWPGQSTSPSGLWLGIASSSDGTHLVAVNRGGQIYTSADSGVTWTAQSGSPSAGWDAVASSSDGTHLVAAASVGQIYTSADSGVTWTAQSGAPSAGWAAVASSSDGTHLVAVNHGGQIYTSADSGVTWTAQSGAPSASWQAVASSSDGTHLVAAIVGGQIYTSVTSGVTWTAQSGAPSGNWLGVASSADGTHLAAVMDVGQIYTSANSGVTWTAQSGAPTTTWYAVASSSDGAHIAAVVAGGQIYTNRTTEAQGATISFEYIGNGQWAPATYPWQVNGSSVSYNAGNVGIGTSFPTNPLQMGSGAYCSTAGVWTSVSDRNVKENFTPIAPDQVLAKVAAMPITQWKYKVEPSGIKHIGPVAQDFHAAFGLGDSDKAIGSVDESGVALAAIQGLNQKLEEENAALQKEAARDKALESRLSRLEQSVNAGPAPRSAAP